MIESLIIEGLDDWATLQLFSKQTKWDFFSAPETTTFGRIRLIAETRRRKSFQIEVES